MTYPTSKYLSSEYELDLEIQVIVGFRGTLSIAGPERYTGRVDALSVNIIYNIDPNHTVCTLHNKN